VTLLLKKLRTAFLTGLIVIVPVVFTYWIVLWLFNLADGLLAGFLDFLGSVFPGFRLNIPGLGAVLTLSIILGMGVLATNLLGRRLIRIGEDLLLRLPVVRSVYQTMKQITDALLSQNHAAFKHVVMVEYPRKGLWTIGFVTAEMGGEVRDLAGEEVINVFFPTTPNPTSGWLAVVPRKDVAFLRMSVEEGLKLVISGGVLAPNDDAPTRAVEER
jgi:uncharacterized membrane protein